MNHLVASLALIAGQLAGTYGHGSLVIPQTRNSIDRLLTPWKGGYPHQPDFPGTGRWGLPNETCGTTVTKYSAPSCQEACSCSNGTAACDVGQACFWFSSGCTIGCDACDGNGRRDGDPCRCPGKCANATLNDPKYRTGNRGAAAGSDQDWTKYNPWRSPGRAPTFDPCGMAGGGKVFGKQFLKWNDDHTEEINGTYVTEGTWPKGSMWAMNPLPDGPTALFKPPCKAGTSPKVRAPMAVGKYGFNPGPCAGNWPTTVNIMDHVNVPKDIAPGEYVLSFRWDCELTAQVWNACSDITIA
eukprot:gene3614-23170_t